MIFLMMKMNIEIFVKKYQRIKQFFCIDMCWSDSQKELDMLGVIQDNEMLGKNYYLIDSFFVLVFGLIDSFFE